MNNMIKIGSNMTIPLPVFAFVSDSKFTSACKKVIVEQMDPLMDWKMPAEYSPINAVDSMYIFCMDRNIALQSQLAKNWSYVDFGEEMFIRIMNLDSIKPDVDVIDVSRQPVMKLMQSMFKQARSSSSILQYGKELHKLLEGISFWELFNNNYPKFKWMLEQYSVNTLLTIDAAIQNKNQMLILNALKDAWWNDLPDDEINLRRHPHGYDEYNKVLLFMSGMESNQ